MREQPATTTDAIDSMATAPTTVGGSPARGPMIVDEHGDNMVLWQVNLLGDPGGSWVVSYDDADTARRLLSMCDRRGLVAVDGLTPVDLLSRWAHDCGVPIDRTLLQARLCSIPAVLKETQEVRDTCVVEVRDAEERDGKHRTPLVWNTVIPGPEELTFTSLVEAASVRVTPGSPESERARLTARLTQWAIRIWLDTETVRTRRAQLVRSFGPAQPLPPSWGTAVTAAYRSPFAL